MNGSMINTESDIVRAGVTGLASLYESGSATPNDVARIYVSRIGRYNNRLNAFIHFNEHLADDARASTRRWLAGIPLSQLDGVPIGVKSNIAVKDLPWDGGFAAYRDRLAVQDADVIARLRQLGVLFIGTLNMEEGALGAKTDNPWFGPCYNPHKEEYTPGGSSGGSGAAVAAGLCAAALGTDTMGSVRIPSAYCGIYGFKPAKEVISTEGVVPLSHSLDTVGPHARSTQDLMALYQAMSGEEVLEIALPRVGVLNWQEKVTVEANVQTNFEAAVKAFANLDMPGHIITLNEYDFNKTRINGLIVSEYEGFDAHQEKIKTDPTGFSDHLKALFQYGANLGTDRIDQAYAGINKAIKTTEAWADVDVLMMPTAPQTAFPMSELPSNQADFTAYANAAGLPALSIPTGKTREGLPLAVQLVGKPGEEAYLFAASRAYSEAHKVDMAPSGYGY